MTRIGILSLPCRDSPTPSFLTTPTRTAPILPTRTSLSTNPPPRNRSVDSIVLIIPGFRGYGRGNPPTSSQSTHARAPPTSSRPSENPVGVAATVDPSVTSAQRIHTSCLLIFVAPFRDQRNIPLPLFAFATSPVVNP